MHTELSAVVALAGGVISVLGPSKGASVVGVALFALGTVLGVAATARVVSAGPAEAAESSDGSSDDDSG
ncbi:hypothetical protein [Haloparvum sp. PAK95]|uniref:hypothetical protein n=1 Tax=Haloparvum sp. PAK95 TaxID=3418962 RepID=UPI003D2EA28D